ncbi:hypothetical protein BGW37DRAFT_191625 [Umbelopsis sp. PMI_123]|nr:hypothetical protein BGW37DRAFT_191625 [Umbelopsis sp. PMI_123]
MHRVVMVTIFISMVITWRYHFAQSPEVHAAIPTYFTFAMICIPLVFGIVFYTQVINAVSMEYVNTSGKLGPAMWICAGATGVLLVASIDWILICCCGCRGLPLRNKNIAETAHETVV